MERGGKKGRREERNRHKEEPSFEGAFVPGLDLEPRCCLTSVTLRFYWDPLSGYSNHVFVFATDSLSLGSFSITRVVDFLFCFVVVITHERLVLLL